MLRVDPTPKWLSNSLSFMWLVTGDESLDSSPDFFYANLGFVQKCGFDISFLEFSRLFISLHYCDNFGIMPPKPDVPGRLETDCGLVHKQADLRKRS